MIRIKPVPALESSAVLGRRRLLDATPDILIDPETCVMTAGGVLVVCEPVIELPMAQRYFLF
ncbi:MAG: hypothetical protein ACKOC1_00545 [Hyphomicrobiales bacterium]